MARTQGESARTSGCSSAATDANPLLRPFDVIPNEREGSPTVRSSQRRGFGFAEPFGVLFALLVEMTWPEEGYPSSVTAVRGLQFRRAGFSARVSHAARTGTPRLQPERRTPPREARPP